MTDLDLELVRTPKPGTTIIDVGANIGYSTLALSRAVGPEGRVVAFEPHPDNVALLEANVRRNGVGNVTVVPGAAMAEPGELVLAEAPLNTGDHRVVQADAATGTVETDGVARTALTVRGTTIDDELAAVDAGPVSLMLLDTQGTEHRALRGAVRTIERHRPPIYVEFWPQGIRGFGDDPVAVLAEYRALGYAHEVAEDPALNELGDEALVAAVHARPGAHGGFVTLVLRPRD